MRGETMRRSERRRRTANFVPRFVRSFARSRRDERSLTNQRPNLSRHVADVTTQLAFSGLKWPARDTAIGLSLTPSSPFPNRGQRGTEQESSYICADLRYRNDHRYRLIFVTLSPYPAAPLPTSARPIKPRRRESPAKTFAIAGD